MDTGQTETAHDSSHEQLILVSSADRTGLEPATSAVTGRHSNQLNYRSVPSKSTVSGIIFQDGKDRPAGFYCQKFFIYLFTCWPMGFEQFLIII
jgi:hypothetical protein